MSIEPVSTAIEKFLAQFSNKFDRYIVAFSGGVDSTVLLHALQQQVENAKILAVYIDHQLQDDSKAWGKQNQLFCQQLNVEYRQLTAEVDRQKASLENQARKARYQALSKFVTAESCLLSAQHSDDQAETFLLQLFRGAGSKGLSAMPAIKPFYSGIQARPLLNVSRQQIENYAQWFQLNFIEDPSNQDNNIRRNFLRNNILPQLEEYWPNVKVQLAKSAIQQSENQSLLEALAVIDSQGLIDQNTLDLNKLAMLSVARRKNVLRYWLTSFSINMPDQKFLAQILQQFLYAEADAEPEIAIDGYLLRRYQHHLFLLHPQQLQTVASDKVWTWDGQTDLIIGEHLVLSYQWLHSNHPELVGKRLQVTGRRQGQKIYFSDKEHGVTVKKYLQQQRVPTWIREQVLLIHHGGKIRGIYIPQA